MLAQETTTRSVRQPSPRHWPLAWARAISSHGTSTTGLGKTNSRSPATNGREIYSLVQQRSVQTDGGAGHRLLAQLRRTLDTSR